LFNRCFEKYVHFGFYYGSQIADPDKTLLGNENQYRYIKLEYKGDFLNTYINIKKLLKEAYANSLAKVNDKTQIMEGQTITKSISPVKKDPD